MTNFSITKLPDIHESRNIQFDNYGNNIVIDNGLCFTLNEISIESKPLKTLKYINLDTNARFIKTDILRDSYIKYPNTLHPESNPYVTLDTGYELGIVDTNKHDPVAIGVSSLLSRSINDAIDTDGGYLPKHIVERAQVEFVSPHAVSNNWGKSGYRFVLTRDINANVKEIVATALIGNSKDTLFFFTSKYNNLRHSTMIKDVDWDLEIDDKKWFDGFSFPKPREYKPPLYNHLANFSVEREGCRGLGLSKILLDGIIKHYALHDKNSVINHSQPLICGNGLFQIADPSWLKIMLNLDFDLRRGAETFFIENEKSHPLPKVIMNNVEMDNIDYNEHFGFFDIYSKEYEFDDDFMAYMSVSDSKHLTHRISHNVKLAQSGKAKLQYYQLIKNFDV